MEGNPFASAVFEAAALNPRHLSLSGAALDRSFQGRATHGQDRMFEYSVSTIDELGVDPAEIGTIMVASLYSVGVPTLAQRLAGHYEMDPAVDTYQLVGVGCTSVVPLVRLMA